MTDPNPRKPIMLWTHPRTVSSALERVMLQRGDLATLHEPFIYLYYCGDAHKSLEYFSPDTAHPTDYTGIRDLILNRAADEPLFVKDMSYYVNNYRNDDPDFVDATINTFLIRTPERSIPSYYRLDPAVSLEEVGVESVYHHYEHVRQLTGERPVVIDAEDLLSDPAGTVRAYCAAVGLPFIEDALHWDSNAVPDEWQHVAGWHTDLAHSGGLGKVRTARGSIDDAPHLREFCAHHMPYYEQLREHRIRPA